MKYENEIQELKDCFIKELLPEKIYLFGSFADDTDREDSDFDFYIVANENVNNLADEASRAYRSIRRVKRRPVDIVIGTRNRFEERQDGYSIENEVRKKGVLLYDRELS